MKTIDIRSFKEVLNIEKNNSTVDFINVCTPAEYAEKHIDGVRSVPLDEIHEHLNEFAAKKVVYVHCRSGNRSKRAIEKLTELGVKSELVNVDGGLLAWDAAGFSTKAITNRMPLMRQVMLSAGALVILAHVLASVYNPNFIYLSLFVGIGMAFAGLTGWCGMAFLLAKMPWNKE